MDPQEAGKIQEQKTPLQRAQELMQEITGYLEADPNLTEFDVYERLLAKKPTSSGSCLNKRPKTECYVIVGLVGYPHHQLEAIEDEILAELLGHIATSGIHPKFTKRPEIHAGRMIFACANRETANWLAPLFFGPHLKTDIEDAIEDEEEEAQAETNLMFAGYFKDSYGISSQRMFDLIEAQNEGVSTRRWTRVRNESCPFITHLTIEIDGESLEALERIDFVLNYGFGQRVRLVPANV